MYITNKNTLAKMRNVIESVKLNARFYDQYRFPDELSDVCSSVCCGAGFVVWEESKELYNEMLDGPVSNWPKKADEILGINSGEKLFFSPIFWPKKFFKAYWNTSYGSIKRANVMAERWEHYIQTGE